MEALWLGLITLLLFGADTAMERPFPTVLPELQYGRNCGSEIALRNTSPRFVKVDVVGHRSTGALASLRDRPTNQLRLAPGEAVRLRLDIEDDTGWAQIVEWVPSPRLEPVLAVSGSTECLDGTELVKEARQIAYVTADPHFKAASTEPAVEGEVLLLINASAEPARWRACYSAGHMVSNGQGEMVPLCDTPVERTLAPFQSWRLPVVLERRTLIEFDASARALAMQLLQPSALSRLFFRVESVIRFAEPGK